MEGIETEGRGPTHRTSGRLGMDRVRRTHRNQGKNDLHPNHSPRSRRRKKTDASERIGTRRGQEGSNAR
eukprot:scaffold2876_cov338-Pavlova_lutheri.AAC.3